MFLFLSILRACSATDLRRVHSEVLSMLLLLCLNISWRAAKTQLHFFQWDHLGREANNKAWSNIAQWKQHSDCKYDIFFDECAVCFAAFILVLPPLVNASYKFLMSAKNLLLCNAAGSWWLTWSRIRCSIPVCIILLSLENESGCQKGTS